MTRLFKYLMIKMLIKTFKNVTDLIIIQAQLYAVLHHTGTLNHSEPNPMKTTAARVMLSLYWTKSQQSHAVTPQVITQSVWSPVTPVLLSLGLNASISLLGNGESDTLSTWQWHPRLVTLADHKHIVQPSQTAANTIAKYQSWTLFWK